MTEIALVLQEPSTKWLGLIMIITVAISFILAMLHKITKTIGLLKDAWLKPSTDYSVQIHIEQAVSDRIRFIKHDLRADRVSIYQYKNGEKSIANIPFLKLIITHETLSTNAESIQIKNREISANVFGHLNIDIFNQQPVIMPSLGAKTKHNKDPLDQDHELRGLYQLLVKNDTKSLYIFPMVNSTGMTIGFGLVEYTVQEQMLEDEWLNWATVQFAGVGGLLASMVGRTK